MAAGTFQWSWAIDDYGDSSTGAAETVEIKFATRQGDKSYGQCLVFAWIEGFLELYIKV